MRGNAQLDDAIAVLKQIGEWGLKVWSISQCGVLTATLLYVGKVGARQSKLLMVTVRGVG